MVPGYIPPRKFFTINIVISLRSVLFLRGLRIHDNNIYPFQNRYIILFEKKPMTFESMIENTPVAPSSTDNVKENPIVNEETLAVKVSYGDDIRRATFNGTTYVALRDLSAKLFELDPATTVLKYQDEEGDNITVVCEHTHHIIRSSSFVLHPSFFILRSSSFVLHPSNTTTVI